MADPVTVAPGTRLRRIAAISGVLLLAEAVAVGVVLRAAA
jgi:hypothetical protein